MSETREPQYNNCLDLKKRIGLTPLGLMSNFTWHDDPKRLTFTLARYKFVAKMLSGKERVLEVGCADAFATRIVASEVKKLVATDFDPVFIEDAKNRMQSRWAFECRVHDMVAGPMPEIFDAAYAMDVLEHIPPDSEDRFLGNIAASLTPSGVLILGCPSIESQAYASAASREGHVNCKTGKDLKKVCEKFFDNVFVFSMNDEVVHTGFYPMAHYLIAVCCGNKSPRH